MSAGAPRYVSGKVWPPGPMIMAYIPFPPDNGDRRRRPEYWDEWVAEVSGAINTVWMGMSDDERGEYSDAPALWIVLYLYPASRNRQATQYTLALWEAVKRSAACQRLQKCWNLNIRIFHDPETRGALDLPERLREARNVAEIRLSPDGPGVR